MSVKEILFLSETGGFQGGVERFLFQAARALSVAGVRCNGNFLKPGKMPEEFAAAFGRVTFGADRFAELAATADLIWLQKYPDLSVLEPWFGKVPIAAYVHDHDYCCFRRHKYFPVGRINCPLAAGTYCRVCGNLSRGHGHWPRFRRNLELLGRSESVLAGSEFMLDTLAANGIRRDKLYKLAPLIGPFGASAPRPVPTEREILFVGQVIRGKGVDLLLRATARLRGEWHLTVVGEGDDLPFCQALAEKSGIAGHVTFAGYTPHPELFYQKAAVAAFPSRWQEPFGMTGPEAQSYGVPVVGFDTGGVGEWLKHEENGLLVPPGDIAAMAAMLERVLDRRDEAVRWGNNAFRQMTAFTPETFAARALELLGKAVTS